MEQSILQQLYDGKIYPAENIKPSNPKYNEADKALSEEINYLMNTLSGDTLKRFKKINDLQCETVSIYLYESFAYGFRLATSLMAESLHDSTVLARKDE
jgi:hypothetical protein